jgi:hypothetical protein
MLVLAEAGGQLGLGQTQTAADGPETVRQGIRGRVRVEAQEADDRGHTADCGLLLSEFPVPHGHLGHSEPLGHVALPEAAEEPLLPKMLPERLWVALVRDWEIG